MWFGIIFFVINFCAASYHEQYRVPQAFSDRWESYVFNSKEYLIQNLPVSWENAKILCGGHHHGSLAVVDTKEKAEFLTEALSESQFTIDSLWVGARRDSEKDLAGYRWPQGVELRRTASDVLLNEAEGYEEKYPLWLNRTLVPVPDGGADCVAIERVQHDKPVFLDLPCELERPFACERDTKELINVKELKTVRCREGLYRIFDGRLEWKQAASYCLLQEMTLANVATMKCLKKLGMAMLKARPSIESAWLGAKGSQGKWNWVDSGESIFQAPRHSDVKPGMWPPMRDRSAIKQNGCLQLDRHETKPPLFVEERCNRKLQFICYQGLAKLYKSTTPPSDDLYYYVLVRQLLSWQHALENCQKMNGTLASLENKDVMIQLLLVMGENKEEPISHIWISGRLDTNNDTNGVLSYAWHNPGNGKKIPVSKSFGDASGLYIPPWLAEDFTMDSPCLNLDRLDHLNGLVYGLPCDTAQYSVCVTEKSVTTATVDTVTEKQAVTGG